MTMYVWEAEWFVSAIGRPKVTRGVAERGIITVEPKDACGFSVSFIVDRPFEHVGACMRRLPKEAWAPGS